LLAPPSQLKVHIFPLRTSPIHASKPPHPVPLPSVGPTLPLCAQRGRVPLPPRHSLSDAAPAAADAGGGGGGRSSEPGDVIETRPGNRRGINLQRCASGTLPPAGGGAGEGDGATERAGEEEGAVGVEDGRDWESRVREGEETKDPGQGKGEGGAEACGG
jgi:hypothetical protein